MSDIEIVIACAKAMGYTVKEHAYEDLPITTLEHGLYNPLVNAAENAALDDVLLKHGHYVMRSYEFCYCDNTRPSLDTIYGGDMTIAANRRRARCECVAKLMEGV